MNGGRFGGKSVVAWIGGLSVPVGVGVVVDETDTTGSGGKNFLGVRIVVAILRRDSTGTE